MNKLPVLLRLPDRHHLERWCRKGGFASPPGTRVLRSHDIKIGGSATPPGFDPGGGTPCEHGINLTGYEVFHNKSTQGVNV